MDGIALMRKWILAEPSITTLLGANEFGSVYALSSLPENYDPKMGPCVQLFAAGGKTHSEIPIDTDRIQMRVWADVEKEDVARQVYKAVKTLIHGATNVNLTPDGFVMSCLEMVSGQDVTDPETGWATVVAFYQLMSRSN